MKTSLSAAGNSSNRLGNQSKHSLSFRLLRRFVHLVTWFKGTLDVLLRESAGKEFDRQGGIYQFQNMHFTVPATLTDRQFRGRFLLGGYENPEEYTLVERFLHPTDSVLELGGCLGVLSCFVNRRLLNPTRHVVVEANPYLIPHLEKNKQLNQCHFTIVHGIISNRPTEGFFLHPLIVGGSTKRRTIRSVQVPGISPGQVAHDYGTFTVLIVDIEGGELALLEQCPTILQDCETLLIEIHPFAEILTQEEAATVENQLFDLRFRKVTASRNQRYQVWQKVFIH